MSSKSKGSEFERWACKYLSEWIQGTEKPYLFWRSPQSGGLATISEENAKLSGDIKSLSEDSAWFCDLYSVEIKTGYPKTSFWQHFKNIKNFNIEQFWLQCVEDAIKAGKLPMLIYRKKRQHPIVGITNVSNLRKLNKLQSITMVFAKDKKIPALTFYDMSNFFSVVTPKYLKERYKIR